MENDVLSLMTINDETGLLAKKIFKLTLVLLVLSILYSIMDLLDWYSFLIKYSSSTRKLPYYLYNHTIRPVIAFFILLFSLLGHILNYKAFAAINTGVEQQDAAFFNKGFKNIYVVAVLSVISLSLALGSICYRYLLFKGTSI